MLTANQVTAFATLVGSALALIATYIYSDSNFNARYDRLETRDREIAQLFFEKPELALVYVPANLIEGNPEQTLQAYFARRIGVDKAEELPKFASIVQFSCNLWSPEFPPEEQKLLMSHYFMAEYHATLLYDTWYGFRPDGRSTEKARVFNLYRSFVNEVGTDVMFMASVFELARYGYYEPAFFNWLRSEMLSSNERRLYYSTVFPEFVDNRKWKTIVEQGRERNEDIDECDLH